MDYLCRTSGHMHSESFKVKMRIPLIVEWAKWFLKRLNSIHFGHQEYTETLSLLFCICYSLCQWGCLWDPPSCAKQQGNKDQWSGSYPIANVSGQRSVTHSSTNDHFSWRLDQPSAFTGKTPRSNTVLQLLEMLCGFPKILGLIHWHKLKCKRQFAHMLASFVFD